MYAKSLNLPGARAWKSMSFNFTLVIFNFKYKNLIIILQ